MPDYKVNFKELKMRVGVTDVAYALGYRLDRKAGVGRYVELVSGDGREKRDTLIVSHPNDRASQTFFRRDGSKGDVLTLIRENLNTFLVTGKDEWQKVAKVMARFANMPEPEYNDDLEYVKSASVASVFDASRYEVKRMDVERIPPIFRQRGLSDETVRRFAPFVSLIRDKRNGNFDGYNIGFPYTDADERVKGYEIRGYGGYKSKAAGTDSSSAAWVADFSGGNPEAVRNVFFCESAFDAMAFHQMNGGRLHPDVALVSLGGTFSDKQIIGVMGRFPNAKAFDCFDNDIAGRIYGLRMIGLLEGIPMRISKAEDGLQVESGDKTFTVNPGKPLSSQLAAHLPVRYRTGQWLPPKAFKDWNDCLLNKPIAQIIAPCKEERDRNLAERRKGNLKM